MKKEITYVAHSIQDPKPIPFSVIKDYVEDDDIISAGFDEGYYSENESWDPHWFIKIERNRLETDEEFEKRKSMENFVREDMKKRRYENYLKLKKEFENE